MKKLIILFITLLMITSSCSTGRYVSVNTQEAELSAVEVLYNQYPDLTRYYEEGVLEITSMRGSELRYRFVKKYLYGDEKYLCLKEFYPELYNLYVGGTITIRSVYKYVDEEGIIQYHITYSRIYDSYYYYRTVPLIYPYGHRYYYRPIPPRYHYRPIHPRPHYRPVPPRPHHNHHPQVRPNNQSRPGGHSPQVKPNQGGNHNPQVRPNNPPKQDGGHTPQARPSTPPRSSSSHTPQTRPSSPSRSGEYSPSRSSSSSRSSGGRSSGGTSSGRRR